eukprot:854303-Rhodomonas_salina.5
MSRQSSHPGRCSLRQASMSMYPFLSSLLARAASSEVGQKSVVQVNSRRKHSFWDGLWATPSGLPRRTNQVRGDVSSARAILPMGES